MIKLFAPLMIAATSLVSPAVAGIHDFTPENVGPVRQTPQGDCYRTKDQSRVCWFRNANGSYNLGIYDTDYPQFPGAMIVNCKTGRWQSYSGMPNEQMGIWARTFCQQR